MRSKSDPDVIFNVIKKEALSGEYLVDARPEMRDMNSSISFRLNSTGAKKFREVTSSNKGRALAIVLDDTVLTAPRINDTIPNGSGTITGNFSSQEAEDLASLLRSGALPAKLNIIEERTVGPSAGSKSINSAKISSAIGALLVMLFMILYYRMLGVVASIAITVNLIISLAVMAIFGVTLTLAGIAAC